MWFTTITNIALICRTSYSTVMEDVGIRVSSKQTKKFWFEPKQTETRSVSVVFRFVSWNQKLKHSVCFGLFLCFEPILKQRKQTELFETNQNNPKFSEKYQNMFSIKMFWWSSVFRLNRNIETLCFSIEVKQPKQTVSKQTKTNQKKPEKTYIFWKNTKICYLSNCWLVGWLVFHLFRFNQNIETLWFGLEAKQLKQTFCFG